MSLSSIKQINDEIYDSILLTSKQNRIICETPDVLETLMYFIKTPISKIFDPIFKPLSDFVQSADLQHPELKFFISKVFSNTFVDKCQQIAKIIDYCEENSLSIHSDFTNLQRPLLDLIDESFHKFMGDPEKTKIYTRFLPLKSRWFSRTFKKTQTIRCKPSNNINILDSYGLMAFHHNSDILLNIKNNLFSKKENMYSMGCTNICKEIDSNIKEIDEIFNLQKYGFHRITISKIVTFLKKQYDFDYINIRPVTSASILNGTSAAKFIDLCENYSFENLGSWPIFDHYAEIYWNDADFSILVGEIDTKSYFICYNFRDN